MRCNDTGGGDRIVVTSYNFPNSSSYVDFFITIAPVYETAPATQRTAAREMRLSFKTGQDVGNGRRPSNLFTI